MAFVCRILAFLAFFGVLQAGGTVQGIITDISNNSPIAGTTVALIKGGTFILSTTKSGADGSYSFQNIPADNYTLRATASGFQTLSIGAKINNNATTTVDFQLQHNPGSIVGKVRDASSLSPLVDATVQVIKNELVIASATTNSSGYFFVDNLAGGTYTVRASIDGYQAYSTGSTVQVNQSSTVNFFLQSHPGSMSGHVISSTTNGPLQGAIVDVLQDMMVIASATTDVSGYYLIPNLSIGNYVVRVSISNYQIDSIGANVTSLAQIPVNFTLHPNPGAVTGKITNQATTYPIVGATVTVFRDTVNLSTEFTDPQGNYTIGDLSPGYYTVRIHAENFQTADIGTTVVSDAITTTNLSLKSDPGRFTGKIVDAGDGTSLSGVLVNVFKENDLNGSAYTDENGVFIVEGLAPDTYVLTTQKSHYQTFALGGEVFPNAATSVNFQLSPAPRTITGRVTTNTPGSMPIAEAIVTIFNGTTFYAIRVTDAGGYYTIDTLPPNPYSVRVSATNYQTETLTADLLSNLIETVRFELNPFPGTIRGRIAKTTDPDFPVAGAVITALSGDDIHASTLSDTNGYYTLSGIAPGLYTIRTSAENFETEATEILIQSNQTLFQDFTLEPESTLVSGAVVNIATNEPIAGALIYIFQGNNLIVNELTDSNGHFSTDELEPGTYTIQASGKNFRSTVQTFTVQPGTENTLHFSLEALPPPPDSIAGGILTNRFYTQSDRIHNINWQRSLSNQIARYDIYRDGELIAAIPAGRPLTFQDHRRTQAAFNHYEVRAIDTEDKESVGVFISLN